MKITEKEVAELIMDKEPVIQQIILFSKDTESTTLWVYAKPLLGEVSAWPEVKQCELWESPAHGGIDFGQKCLNRKQVINKLLNIIRL